MLVVTAICGLARPALADPQSLSANLPVRIKDAFDSGNFGDVGIYATERYTEDRSGRYSLAGGPKLKIGLAPGLAINLLPANRLGTGRSIRGGLASAAVEYQVNSQSTYIPAILIEGIYKLPYQNTGSSEYHFVGVGTKFLGPSAQSPRLDLEINWGHVTAPIANERTDRVSVGAAYSRLITEHDAAVVDAVHQERHFTGKLANFLDLGINHELSQAALIGVGAGTGIGPKAPLFRVFAGLRWTFHLF